MRVIVVLSLVAVAVAQYDYSVRTQAPLIQQFSTAPQLSIQQPQFHAPLRQYIAPLPQYSAPAPQYTAQAPKFSAQLSEPIQPVEEYNKEFYSYTAPEHEFINDAHPQDSVTSSIKKNLRVIFIKGPENNGVANTAVQLAKHLNEERTAIYVLHKQADVNELATKFNSVTTINQKPEVHFIKYRTAADAANAQRTIQSQYDALPGSSSSHNNGVVPVLDFASKPAAHASQGTYYTQAAPAQQVQQIHHVQQVQQQVQVEQAAPAHNHIAPLSPTYLPPVKKS